VIARTRRLQAFLLIASMAVAACGAAPAPTPTLAPATPVPSAAPTATPVPPFPATITDDEGTTVTLPAAPAKIATLTPAATETVFALGIGDRLVGKVEDFSLYPPEAATVPDVAKFGSVDVEKIVALGAELVIAGGDNFNPPEAIAKLRSLGVPVLVFSPDPATILDDIARIGLATGRPDEAATIAADIAAAFDEVKAATAALPKVRVFYELDASSGYFGPAPDFFGTEMIRIAGGDPLTSGTNGVYQIEAEQILAFDPQVILLADGAWGMTAEQVAARPGWDVLTAVKDNAIRPIDDVVTTRPGPRLTLGIQALALAIHPDLVLPSVQP
jgi:iron complex transport system substrate-binding protein